MSSPLIFADRMQYLRSNVFADMDAAKQKAVSGGKTLIDLSLGSSDLSTSPIVLEAIQASLGDSSTHGYVLFGQTLEFRETVAQWFTQRFGIPIDAETEVLPLIGSQEGTAHLPLAILNPGDGALLQDPGYPSHYGGVYLAGGVPWGMPLREERNFLPDFAQIPPEVLSRSRLMVLSYPHNPTAALAPIGFFEEAVEFCQSHNLWLAHDFPYMDIVFDGVAPSMLEADRQKSVTIEFFTLSKSYNMGGFRVGFAVGNRDLIQALRQVKAVVDFNQYQGILRGGIRALQSDPSEVRGSVAEYRARRDFMVQSLKTIGWEVPIPKATMYIWAALPSTWRGTSMAFCQKLITETGVILSPGSGFGQCGEGYVRFALVHPIEVLQTAIDRISNLLSLEPE